MTSYRVGDWVYCETGPHQPYVIRKIEELTKTPCGNVEAKVICAFRRQDIPASVMATVEKYQKESKEAEKKDSESESETKPETKPNDPTASYSDNYDEKLVANLTEQQRYNLRHRELYFSKYTDTIAATTIRAKCSVLLFNEEVEKYSDYLAKDDQFFYHLTYDPYQKSIVHDQGEIRVGQRYQAEIPGLQVTPNGTFIEEVNEAAAVLAAQEDKRVLRSKLKKDEEPEVPFAIENMEKLIWSPISPFNFTEEYSNKLTDNEIDQFMIIAKSVGTYARALDCNNAFKQPSLPLSAASASRDITLFYAMNSLHENNYDIAKACLSFIPKDGPIICKDEIEDWSAAEANIFEEAFDKIGKDFGEIRREYLPWKSFKSIIEYYYTWKTTDRYVQQKRIKLSEQESKLKQVYIPNHSKQNQSALIKSVHVQLFNQYETQLKQSCESCGTPNTSTNQWYAYNLNAVTQLVMSGNHNPAALANAAAQLAAQHQNNNSNNHITLQARLCADCWNYWKKFHAFKFPNARQERLNQLKNQTHKCSVNGCGREFKMKQLLVKHCGIAHGYFAKANLPPGQNSPRPSAIRNRTSFYLLTTPMTQAARLVCTNSIKLKKLSRKPFKLVELNELNKEWSKDSKRNIEKTLVDYRKKTFKTRNLSKELITVIAKSYAKLLKRKKQADNKLANGTANGNHDENSQEDDNSEDDELVIEDDNEAKPEYLKYFENKATEPCFVPEKLIWAKPDKETMNKFYENLMSQNRKRPHEAITQNGETGTAGKTENSSTDSSPMSKRTLLNSSSQNPAVNGSKSVRVPHKYKPIQSINLLNAPEEIYYVANKHLRALRKDIEAVALRKLSRKPSRELAKTYENLYETVAKIRTEDLAKVVKANPKKLETEKPEEKSEKEDKKEDNEVEMSEDKEENTSVKEVKEKMVVLD